MTAVLYVTLNVPVRLAAWFFLGLCQYGLEVVSPGGTTSVPSLKERDTTSVQVGSPESFLIVSKGALARMADSEDIGSFEENSRL